MEKMPKRILIKICSTRPVQWAARKFVMAKFRKAQKAPEVQERMKDFMAAPPGEGQFYAHFEAMMAVCNQMAKSKWVEFDPAPPETMRGVRFKVLLAKIEHGKATASDIEEFRPLAEEIMRSQLWTQWPPDKRQRIEAALARVVKKETE